MKIFIFFIILHDHGLQSMYPDSGLSFLLANHSNCNNKITRLEDLITELDDLITEFAKKTESNNAVIKHNIHVNAVVTNNHTRILQQIVHEEVLQDINASAEELRQLKNQLCNESMHLNRYRQTVEKQLKLHDDNLEKLNLLYTSLRFDVNLVNLENVKQQIDIFHNSAIIGLNEMNILLKKVLTIQDNLDKAMVDYKSDLKCELEKANEQINAKLAAHSKGCEIRNNDKLKSFTVFSVGCFCVLTFFIAYQQHQINLLKQHFFQQL